MLGDTDGAEKHQLSRIAILEALPGESPRLLEALQDLAEMYLAMKSYDNMAETVLRATVIKRGHLDAEPAPHDGC